MTRAAPPRRPPAPDPIPSPGRSPVPSRYLAAGLAAVHLAVVLLLLAPTPFDGGDNAAYLALARSLLADGSYRELWDPAAAPHTQYPPGWPLVLAGALAAGVKPWTGFKVLVALFSAAGVALSYLWARRAASPGVALGVGLLLALGPGVVDLARVDLSDVPFWAFSLLALLGFTTWAARDPGDGPRFPTTLAVAVGAVLLAYLTRSAGLPLVVAAGAWLARGRRWGALGLLSAVVVPFAAGWAARGRRVGSGGYGEFLWYTDPYRPELGTVGMGGLLRRMGSNVLDYAWDHLPFLLTGARTGWIGVGVGTATVVLAAAGWGLRVRRREGGLAAWWLPLYLGLVLVWPAEWSGERFLLPVLPVLLVFAGEAVAGMAARLPRPTLAARGAFVAAVGVCLALALPALVREGARIAHCRAVAGPLDPFACMRPPAADFLALARSVRGQLPAGSAVISRKPTLWWAESGYPSRVFPYSADPDTLLAAAREAGAHYLVIDAFDNVASLHLVPAIAQRPQAFCVMRSLGADRASLMGILPGAASMPNLRGRPSGEVLDVGFSWCPAEFWAPGAAPPEAR